MAQFTVDTHLFRELGELLVGRDSTALIELVKNAYDADATKVTVYGRNLQNEDGFIVITDNGTGMTPCLFQDGFLRIASRSKGSTSRHSKRFERRYTGSKGIGRLAAHKLARQLTIRSTPDLEIYGLSEGGVDATIDWDEIENHETLDSIRSGVKVESIVSNDQPGTVIELRKLRKRWTEASLNRFVGEVKGFEPPAVLAEPLPETIVPHKLLFDTPKIRDARIDGEFTVDLSGDFDISESFWRELAEGAQWVIEILAAPQSDEVKYVIGPTRSEIIKLPSAKYGTWSCQHPDPQNGPFFTARILVRTKRFPQSSRSFALASSGVRIYMEGFRVLPYGERGDDWLELDADYTRRREPFDLDKMGGPALESPIKNEGVYRLANSNYYGGVFLTDVGAPTLKPLINREGFLPGEEFTLLRKLIRRGIDMSVRARAAAAEAEKSQHNAVYAVQDSELKREPGKDTSIDDDLMSTLETIEAVLKQASQLGNHLGELEEKLREAVNTVQVTRRLLSDNRNEMSLLRITASVGTQFSAFMHEITALLAQARAIGELTQLVADDPTLSTSARRMLGHTREAIGELTQNLERQVSFLTEVMSVDARRRRRRLPVEQRVHSAVQLLTSQLKQCGQVLEVEIDPELKTPPMFSSELLGILINILSNAIKAAGSSGRIRVRASESDTHLVLSIANTGEAVDLNDSERWFEPFESTTSDIDEILGQGMGLGLPIVRRILDEYSGTVNFVTPEVGFATQINVLVPLRGRGK